ncbi:hypothetical protein [Chryseobacterium sp. IT-36CA2]|uniref:hypothetical protein n=1 Tax=Chryseobacterium sp. IT-36CA2 TaxID=3026460 RepID=UPI0039E1C146
MLSSADLHLERALFLAVLIIFFGAGILCTLIILIIHSLQKKNKTARYYFLSFLLSGVMGLILAAFYLSVILS